MAGQRFFLCNSRLKSLYISLFFALIIWTGSISAQTISNAGTTTHRNSIGPFEIYNADSSSHVRFQFAGQLRNRFYSQDMGNGTERENTFSMEARRLRWIINASMFNDQLSAKVHLSTLSGSLELMDYFFNYKSCGCFQVRYGQFKIPFTRYRMQSFTQLTFVDWSIVTRYFGAERQLGMAVHNGYEKPPEWGYVFGVFSGDNARASHAIALPKLYGLTLTNPSKLSESTYRPRFHPELVLHLSYNPGNIKVQSDSDPEGGSLRYSLGFSGAWDIEPVKHEDLNLRLAGELLTKYRGFSLSSIGYLGFVEQGDNNETHLAFSGFLVQGAYRLNRLYEVSSRVALVDVDNAIYHDILAFTQDEMSLQRELEVTGGFNVYIEEHSLKLQMALTLDREYLLYETRDNFIAQTQIQLAF